MSNYQLSKGCLKNLFSNSRETVKPPIVVQVTNVKPVFLNNELKKYRILITDGEYTGHGLIDEACLPYVSNNAITKFSVIQINEFNTFSTQKHILLIRSVELLVPVGDKVNSKDFINVDTYFAEHPEEDNLLLAKKSQSPAPGSFDAPQQQQQQQQQQLAPQPPANHPGKPPGRIAPIESLSPYQNNWLIKARVSYKGDLRSWSNSRGEGKLFNVNFLDESDEIRATAFNEIAEKYYKMLEEGKVYYITKARVQASKKKFNHLSHPYELSLERDTEITECFDTSNVPKLHFNFVKLNQVQNLEPNAIVDVIGALKTVNESYQITAKSTGKAFERRNITIVDETGFAIDVGLWNSTAVDFNTPEGAIIAFKSCKVQDFNGRSLTLTHAGSMIANPETPESYQLKGWYDNEGINENFKSLKVESTGSNPITSRKTIAEAQEENLGKNERPDFFGIKATISYTKHETFCYPACPQVNQGTASQTTRAQSTCNRKLVQQSDETWRCEKCDMNFNEPMYRYIFNCAVMDTTGQIWITLFDQEARTLFGIDAGEMLRLSNEDNAAFTEKIASITLREYNFRIKARQDTYNDTIRVRYQAAGVELLDYNQEAEALCKELDALLN